ncbi:MAG: MBL fold metallo-hydrolase [Burkholderiales bacterium]
MAEIRFCGFPDAVVLDAPGGKPVKHLLWGDWLELTGRTQDDWVSVHARGESGWLRRTAIQTERLLEVVFVDIGQGDGCLLSTPTDRHLVIDAGEGDNMFRFLRWRFGQFHRRFEFDAFVITHPDADHYGGFAPLVDEKNVAVRTLYHGGLVERSSAVRGPLGSTAKAGNTPVYTEVMRNRTDLDQLLTPAACKGRNYAQLLRRALDGGRVADIRAIDATDGQLPGYEAGNELSIRVLSPVPTEVSAGVRGLRSFGDTGKTKNGHSIVLRVQYRDVSLLLGGDLNVPAEEHLLRHYTKRTVPPKTAEDEEAVVRAARTVFECDFAKACHHGSADFSEVFLKSVNARATVISSGDDEPYSHPRAETLGAIGKHSRGRRPLIFSTELARSARETIKQPYVLRQQFRDAVAALEAAIASGDAKRIDRARAAHDKLTDALDRSIAVYGAVNLRTDGHRVVIAQKIEAPTQRYEKGWDIATFVPDPTSGDLTFSSRY